MLRVADFGIQSLQMRDTEPAPSQRNDIFTNKMCIRDRLVSVWLGSKIRQLPDTGCLGTLGFYRAGGIPCSR